MKKILLVLVFVLVLGVFSFQVLTSSEIKKQNDERINSVLQRCNGVSECEEAVETHYALCAASIPIPSFNIQNPTPDQIASMQAKAQAYSKTFIPKVSQCIREKSGYNL